MARGRERSACPRREGLLYASASMASGSQRGTIATRVDSGVKEPGTAAFESGRASWRPIGNAAWSSFTPQRSTLHGTRSNHRIGRECDELRCLHDAYTSNSGHNVTPSKCLNLLVELTRIERATA